MTTGLEKFKQRMEPAKQMYTREIGDFASRFDALGKMTTSEFPDIDCQEYIFEFEKAEGTCEEELDEIHSKLHQHMSDFAKAHGIEDFCQWARIWL